MSKHFNAETTFRRMWLAMGKDISWAQGPEGQRLLKTIKTKGSSPSFGTGDLFTDFENDLLTGKSKVRSQVADMYNDYYGTKNTSATTSPPSNSSNRSSALVKTQKRTGLTGQPAPAPNNSGGSLGKDGGLARTSGNTRSSGPQSIGRQVNIKGGGVPTPGNPGGYGTPKVTPKPPSAKVIPKPNNVSATGIKAAAIPNNLKGIKVKAGGGLVGTGIETAVNIAEGQHPLYAAGRGFLSTITGSATAAGTALLATEPTFEGGRLAIIAGYNQGSDMGGNFYDRVMSSLGISSAQSQAIPQTSSKDPQPVSKQEFDSGRNTEPPNRNPNVPQKGTSMGGFADIRGSITPGSATPAPNNNSGERSHEYEKEWQKSKKSVDGDVSKAEVPSLDKSYGSMSRQEMMDAYDRMRYGDNFDKAREAMGKAKGNPFDSTNNPAKFLVNEEGQKKAVKQGIEMNKHFFAPGGGREREINNPSLPTPPSLSDISTSHKGDGRAAFKKATKWNSSKSSGGGWKALGPTIKFAEGTHRMGEKSYNTGFGYSMFDDLSKHPDKLYKTGGKPTSAAGAYQFITTTWNRAASALDLKDFGPESQERAGEWLTQERGVQTQKPFTTVAELKDAFKKISPEWASIPDPDTGKSAYDGDGVNSARAFEDLRKFYEKQVGYKLKD